MWTRRAFLKAAGAGLGALLAPRSAEALDRAEMVFASATRLAGGAFGATLISETGAVIARLALPDRGHDIVYSPAAGRGVVFARQPGNFALVFDPDGRAPPRPIRSADGRHFFGHGAFSHDGALLYATENDFERARGVIGIYDARSAFRRVGEFDTFGIGPHEMLLLPDGESFAIANGGIETHPDYGRSELNLDRMEPSLTFVGRADGRLLGKLTLGGALFQLSIRHLAVDGAGRVWFGCQFRGPPATRPPLLGYATRDGEIQLIELPEGVLAGLNNYIGSIAASADGARIAASSPEGDGLVVLAAADGALVDALSFKNVCGLAPARAAFVASNGPGAWRGVGGGTIAPKNFDFGFDNHLRRLA